MNLKLIILLAVLFAPTLCAQDLSLSISLQKEIYLEKECIPIVTVLHNNTENEIKFSPQHYLSSLFELIIIDSTGNRPTKLFLPRGVDLKTEDFVLPQDENYIYSFFINTGYANVINKNLKLRKTLSYLKSGKYKIQARYKYLKLTEKKFTPEYYRYHQISSGTEVADSIYSNIIEIAIVKPDAKQSKIYNYIENEFLSYRTRRLNSNSKIKEYLNLVYKYPGSPYKNNLFYYITQHYTVWHLQLIKNFNQEFSDLISQFPDEFGTLILFINNPELVESVDLNGKKFSEEFRKFAKELMVTNTKISNN